MLFFVGILLRKLEGIFTANNSDKKGSNISPIVNSDKSLSIAKLHKTQLNMKCGTTVY